MRTRLALMVLLPGTLALAFVPAPAPAQPPVPAQPARPAGLDAVPTDSFAFFTVNVGKLWDTPNFKPLREWFAAQKIGPTDEAFGVPAADIERFTVFVTSPTNAESSLMVLVTTKQPYNEAKVLKALQVENRDRDVRRAGRAIRTHGDAFEMLVFADDRTLLFVSKMRDGTTLAEYLGQLIAKKTDGPLAEALADAGKHDIAFAIDARPLGALFEVDRAKELTPFLALFKSRTITFAADFDKTARGALKLTFADGADAKRAAPVLKEGAAELVATAEKELEKRKDKMDALERYFLETAVTVLKAAKFETDGANVFALAEVPYSDAVAKFTAALPKSYIVAINSAKGQNNLKQLALAMLNYSDAYGVYASDSAPPANKPLAYSWRVQILPFIEQANLYQQLVLQKPWDDPANLAVLEKAEMPKAFEIPGRPAPKGHTYFRVFSLPKNAKGKDRPFLTEGQLGPKVVEITDGTSNTFMIVEAREAVPWYKPDVLGYDGVLPLPPLGDKGSDKFLVAFADGSTRVMRRDKLDEKTLRALITIQGGEVIKLP
jgi:hypothetical protein